LLARDGQLSPARVAFEQLNTKFAFERPDLARQHRLGDVQPIGGAAEVQFLGDCHEVTEFAHVEVGSDHTGRVSLRDEKSLGLRRQSGPTVDA
jgi:hypothetical protein